MEFILLSFCIFYMLSQTMCSEKLSIPFNNININPEDLKSVVGIISTLENSSNHETNILLCLGILIHSRAALIEKSCLPTNYFTQNISVQTYDWSLRPAEKKISSSLIRISEIDSNFTILIVEKGIDNDWVTDSYKMNTSIDQPCFYLDMQVFGNDLTRDAYLTSHLSEEKCCNIFGDFYIHFKNKRFQCRCQNHPNSFCASLNSDQCFHKGKQGSPILCPSMNDNTTYVIAGLLIDNDGCDYHFEKIIDLKEHIQTFVHKINNDIEEAESQTSIPSFMTGDDPYDPYYRK